LDSMSSHTCAGAERTTSCGTATRIRGWTHYSEARVQGFTEPERGSRRLECRIIPPCYAMHAIVPARAEIWRAWSALAPLCTLAACEAEEACAWPLFGTSSSSEGDRPSGGSHNWDGEHACMHRGSVMCASLRSVSGGARSGETGAARGEAGRRCADLVDCHLLPGVLGL
jgi:hypothetical protein